MTTIDEQASSKTTFGFWIYLMTDCMLFASLFATYAVLQGNTFGGETAKELFHLPFALTETLILLTSSFTCGLAIGAMRRHNLKQLLILLSVTYLLGLSFLAMELYEFRNLALEGNSWTRSGFLSAFFTLVGTHGLHIASGLLWLLVLIIQLLRRGLTATSVKRLALFGMFWHFLDIIWICIFTFVYLMGAA